MMATGRLGVALGSAAGWIVAPIFGFVSFVRHARTFHPRGPLFQARVEPHVHVPPELTALAQRLCGYALLRFSGALWKRSRRLPDVLGCAVRLRHDDRDTLLAGPADQDLLFATIRRPWTMPFSPLTTDVRDYLNNDYYAVAPFEIAGATRSYLRLRTCCPQPLQPGDRDDRLTRAVNDTSAVLALELGASPFGPWTPVVTLTIERPAQLDGEGLRFSPFRSGRGLQPVGFVHALRRGVYALSQRARPG